MLRELTDEDTDFGELIELDEFIGMCVEEELEDSDGYGKMVMGQFVETKTMIVPSEVKEDPRLDEDYTHVLWFRCS